MEQLQFMAFRLPPPEAGLAELAASPLFAGPDCQPEVPEADQAWARQQRQQPVTALEWRVLLASVCALERQSDAKPCQHIVSLLAWAAEGARQQLEAAAAGRVAGGEDAGNPRHMLALHNTLKLALAVLCLLARGQGSDAGADQGAQDAEEGGGPRKGKKAKGGGAAGGAAASSSAAASVLSQLHVRRDALLAIDAIAAAVGAGGAALLPAVADIRAAERLWRATALHCLVHPLALGSGAGGAAGAAGSSIKAAVEACYQAVAGILSRPFREAAPAGGDKEAPGPDVPPRAPSAAATAAAHTLQELLGVVSEPKQAAQVLTAAARLLSSIAQQNTRAGVAIASSLAERCVQLAAESSKAGRSDAAAAAAALAGQRLDACLHFAALLASPAGAGASAPPAAAALLLCLPRMLPLARLGRASTRRLLLELFSGLLAASGHLPQPGTHPGRAGTSAAAAVQSALLAALCASLRDKDATLRAKALACLERHVAALAVHVGTPPCGALVNESSSGGSGGSSDVGAAFLQALRCRLCDKSPSVRRRAIALLAALTQQGQGAGAALAPTGAARLAEAVLPVASQLLGLRPDSAVHPGEEGLKALSNVVLCLAGRGSSASGLLPLLQLAASVGDPNVRTQLQGAVMDSLLPSGQQPAPADALLCNLAAALPRCSREQVQQLRQAVQVSLASGRRQAARAVISQAVCMCYKQLHTVASAPAAAASAGSQVAATPDSQDGEAVGGRDGTNEAALEATAAALFVLGPFSSAQDQAASVAEAGLLLRSLVQLAAGGNVGVGIGSGSSLSSPGTLCWLLGALAHAIRLLAAGEADAAAQGCDSLAGVEQQQQQQEPAWADLARAAPSALQALLLCPAGSNEAVRRGAIEAALAFPPAAQVLPRLLQSLTAACCASGAEDTVPGQQPGEPVGHYQNVQLRALLPLLELLGRMAGGYERQRAAFRRRLAEEAGQRGEDGGQHPPGISRAGRPLRPAAEWWVGDGHVQDGQQSVQQPHPGTEASTPAEGAASGSGFDYMSGEDQAAKQDAAAQRFLDSLLEAADTPPACFLPLLERLAGGGCAVPAGGAEQGGGPPSVPAPVQAAALTALGRLAVLSEPVCARAVQLAQYCLAQGSSAGDSCTSMNVQQAAVHLLADAIDAYPNAFGSKLPLIGRLMVPSVAGPGIADTTPSAGGGAPAVGEPEWLSQVAAAAYCRLLLRNKLKLQDRGMLRPVGCALAGGGPGVAALARHALRQLLQAAAPKDRARLCLDVFHQTPLQRGWRGLLAEELVRPSSGLLSEPDLRSDVLASQALQALLAAGTAVVTLPPGNGSVAAAAGTAEHGGEAAGASVEAAGVLLRGMRPSAKVLGQLSTQLQSGGAASSTTAAGSTGLLGKLPPAARRALAAFVSNHVATTAGAAAAEDEEAPAPRLQAGGAAAAATAPKRKRGAPGSVALQQQLLQLLGSGGGGGRHVVRPPRRGTTAGGVTVSAARAPSASTVQPEG